MRHANVEEIKDGEICYGILNLVKPTKNMTKEEAEEELTKKIRVTSENKLKRRWKKDVWINRIVKEK